MKPVRTRQRPRPRPAQPDELLEKLHQLVEARLARTDQRYTNGRRAIIALLASAGNPVSITEIARSLPDLPRSSAYRNLVDLESAGVVRRVVAHDEFARFELAEDLTEHHHHLVCVACGKVTDVTLAARVEHNLSEAIIELAGAEGFRPHGHRLDVLGLCRACS
jgi:Fe2+ or Zn2+ uptake regulation protein